MVTKRKKGGVKGEEEGRGRSYKGYKVYISVQKSGGRGRREEGRGEGCKGVEGVPGIVNIRHELVDLLTAVVCNVFGQRVVLRGQIFDFEDTQHLG